MEHIVSRGHSRPLSEISYIEEQNRTLLISAAHDKSAQIRNGESGDWIGSFLGHKGAIWSAKLDPRTAIIAATAAGDFTAKLWCAVTGKELYEFKHKHVVKTLDFTQDSLRLATGCQDGAVRVFTTASPEAAPVQITVSEEGSAASSAPTRVVWFSDNLLSVGTRNGKLKLYDVRASSVAATIVLSEGGDSVMDIEPQMLNNITTTALIACGNKVFSVRGNDGTILQTYDMPSPMTFANEGGASLHPDGSRFIAGGSDLWLREFNAESGEVLRTFKGHHGPVRCVRYHPTGDMVASGSEDATIRLWDLSQKSDEDEVGTSPTPENSK